MFRSSITYGNNPKVNLTQKITYIKWSPEHDDLVYSNGRLEYYASPKTNVMLEDYASEHMNESIERITFENHVYQKPIEPAQQPAVSSRKHTGSAALEEGESKDNDEDTVRKLEYIMQSSRHDVSNDVPVNTLANSSMHTLENGKRETSEQKALELDQDRALDRVRQLLREGLKEHALTELETFCYGQSPPRALAMTPALPSPKVERRAPELADRGSATEAVVVFSLEEFEALKKKVETCMEFENKFNELQKKHDLASKKLKLMEDATQENEALRRELERQREDLELFKKYRMVATESEIKQCRESFKDFDKICSPEDERFLKLAKENEALKEELRTLKKHLKDLRDQFSLGKDLFVMQTVSEDNGDDEYNSR